MMTPQEHYLMLVLYGRQNAKFNILVEILIARGVLESDDLEAFQQAALYEGTEFVAGIEKVWKEYQSIAESLQLDTGLQGGPFPPKKIL